MWAGFLIISKKSYLTDDELNARFEKYSTLIEVEEYEYSNLAEFKETYEDALLRFPHEYEFFQDELKRNPEAAEFMRPKMEALKEKNIRKYLVAYGNGDYRLEGDIIFCNKNYRDGKFDYSKFPINKELTTKDGKKVHKCKISDWDCTNFNPCIFRPVNSICTVI